MDIIQRKPIIFVKKIVTQTWQQMNKKCHISMKKHKTTSTLLTFTIKLPNKAASISSLRRNDGDKFRSKSFFTSQPFFENSTLIRTSSFWQKKTWFVYRVVVPIGRITSLVRPSVRPSVCPVRASNSKTKRRGKPKYVWAFPGAGATRLPIFSWEHQISGGRPHICLHWADRVI